MSSVQDQTQESQTRRSKNFVARIQAGEIYARYEDEERRGEFVLFNRIVVSGKFSLKSEVI